MKVISLIALLCVLASSVVCVWTEIKKDDGTIAITTSFWANDVGYVAGGTAAVQPLFLYTTDGGQNFQNKGMNDSSTGAMLSVRMAGSKWGVAGALGFFGLPCGAVTNDGTNWASINEDKGGPALICAFPGAAVVDDGKTGVLIGSWAGRRDWNGNGIKITTDGGVTWDQYNGVSSAVPERYGSFLNQNAGYITASTWPGDTNVATTPLETLLTDYHLTRHIRYNSKTGQMRVVKPARPTEATGQGYIGMISAVSNAGKTWKTVVNVTDQGFYFNEIDCVDVNTCWAVTEGINTQTGADQGTIVATTDGWATYTTQLTVPNGILIAADMYNSTFGWVGGATDSSGTVGVFYKTTDGVNWTLDSQIPNFLPTDISVTDATHAYSAGMSPAGFSSFASYSA